MSLMRGEEVEVKEEVEVEVRLVLSSSEVEEDEEQEEEEEEERSETAPFWDLLPFSGNHGNPKGSDSVKFELNNAGTVANPSGVTDIWREERERERERGKLMKMLYTIFITSILGNVSSHGNCFPWPL